MANRQLEANSAAVRKKLEARKFTGDDGEEYGASKFGEFGDYFRRKKIKLQNEDIIMRHSVTGKPQIFKDVVAHVASYTQPPPEELRRELVLHGAAFIKYLDYKTMATHIIASTLPPKKADEWRRLRVVKPAWVVDSIAAGKMLPWTDYRLINEGPGQKRIQFDGGKLAVQEGEPDQMAGYKEQSKDSFYTNQMQKIAAAHDKTKTAPVLFPALETVQADANEDEYSMAEMDAMDDQGMDIERGPPYPMKQENGAEDWYQTENSHVLGTNDEVGNLDVESTVVDRDVADTYAVSTSNKPKVGQTASENSGLDRSLEEFKSPSKTYRSPSKQKPMTSEEHNAVLLSDPKIRKSSTANPEFLKQFYSESRLHHLSTWKAELKSKMQRLAAERSSQTLPAKGSVKRKPGSRRYVMHVDFDSFFCAVSLKSAPEYIDKPAVVAHSTGHGSEIASCNYPARAKGVKNGMWMGRATELCPDLKVVPYDFPAYEEASRLFYEAILDIGGVVQSVSIDEALVDITTIVLTETSSAGFGVSEGSIYREQLKADELATKLRQQVKDTTGCHVSVGIGGNILLAKVALRRAKPAGQYQVRPEEVLDILGELTVEQLPGVAYSIGGKLEEIGVKLVRDLRSVSKERLTAVVGPKTGQRLWEYARGIDHTEVGDQPIRKSVSAEVNWGIRFISQEEAEEFVMNLCKELERRLLNEQVRGRNLTMKIMRRSADAPLDPEKHLGHGKCDVFNKTVAFGLATHDAELIGKEAVSILRSFRITPGDLRGLGVQLQKLEPIRAAKPMTEGSQKKLSFGNVSSLASRTKPTGISNLPETTSYSAFSATLPIKETTPKKEVSPPRIMSTQFFMPTDTDFSVLAELPPDIIRRMVSLPKEGESRPNSSSSSRNMSPAKVGSRPQSPAGAMSTTSAVATDELPPDIDPEVFEALPPDVRAEVLAEYRRGASRQPSNSPAASPRRGQKVTTTVPSSTKGIKGKKTKELPVKRGLWGTRGLAAAAAARERRHDAEANRVQSNLVVHTPNAPTPELAAFETGAYEVDNGDNMLEDLDPEVLAALPEDMRAEVLEDYRRRRQEQLAQQPQAVALRLEVPGKNRFGADATITEESKRGIKGYDDDGLLDGEEGLGAELDGKENVRLQFPAPPPKMSFRAATENLEDDPSAMLLSLEETKQMIATWHGATRDDGPHETDVEVLDQYLAGVVSRERDMEKARKLVVWLDWLVEEDSGEGNGGTGKQAWKLAVVRIKKAVQEALQSRGLGPMQFR